MPSFVKGAGDLRERVQLMRRALVSDGVGGTVPGGEFELVNTVWANIRPLKGGESVLEARLQGRQPHIVTVRSSSLSREIDESWQMVDARNGERKFAIVAPPTDPDGKRAWLEILVVEGGAS
ncbi:MAG: head-tail adaptor protein [Devosia sp.]